MQQSRFKKCNRCWYIGFCQRTNLAILKSDVAKLNIDKLKIVLSNLSNLKCKVDKLDVDKLVPSLIKLNDVVKKWRFKKMYITLQSKILKIKYLILLT